MIKVIKEGKTDFRMTCNKCGCVFEYNVVDIDDGYIKCPTCGKKHYGFGSDYELEKNLGKCEPTELKDPKQFLKADTIPVQTTPIIPNYDLKMSYKNDCEWCPTYKQLCSPATYVGDLPCQWCTKSPWKVTCDAATCTTSASVMPDSPSVAQATDKITCKAEGVEYTTNLETCSNYYTDIPVNTTYTAKLEPCSYECAGNITSASIWNKSCFTEEASAQK